MKAVDATAMTILLVLRNCSAAASAAFSSHRTIQHRQYLHHIQRPYPRRIQNWNALNARAPSQQREADDLNKFSTQQGQERQYQQRLRVLQQQLICLNGGKAINVNSPKQVSEALFGCRTQCVNKKALEHAAATLPRGSSSQKLAQTILQYKALQAAMDVDTKKPPQHLSSRGRGSTIQARTFSSTSATDSVTPPLKNTKTPVSSTPVSSETLDADEMLESQSQQHPCRTALAAEETFVQRVHNLFDEPDCKIDPYWKQPLLDLTSPAAQALVRQLDSTLCPMGFNPKAWPRRTAAASASSPSNSKSIKKSDQPKATTLNPTKFVQFCQAQKQATKTHECVILARCGDFYESYGVDAILLVQHANLNPMGGKAKAGCPKGNIQQTLDDLTGQGFSVAVYEERGAATGTAKLKPRSLQQIVTPASPDYIYEMTLKDSVSGASSSASEHGNEARPYVGILNLAAGYTLVELHLDVQKVRVLDRMTEHAVQSHLITHPPADPVWYVPRNQREYYTKRKKPVRLPSLLPPSEGGGKPQPSPQLRVRLLDPSMLPGVTAGRSEAEQARLAIVSAVLKEGPIAEQPWEGVGPQSDSDVVPRRHLTVDDILLVQTPSDKIPASEKTYPLQLETATQLGLVAKNNPSIPGLLEHALPRTAPAAAKRLMEEWLLVPPPHRVTEAMAQLIQHARFPAETSTSLPRLTITSMRKVLPLLRAQEASAAIFKELVKTLQSTQYLMKTLPSDVLESLMIVLEYESGLTCASPQDLYTQCKRATNTIQSVVATEDNGSFLDTVSLWENSDDNHEVIPLSFLDRNELSWRGRVKRTAAPEIYNEVEQAAQDLKMAMLEDFWCLQTIEDVDPKQSPVMYDFFDNLLSVKSIPKKKKNENYFHPRDRNGKEMKKRYTTERVQHCLGAYVDLCDKACDTVSSVLMALSRQLHQEQHVPTIIQAVQTNLILSTVHHHALNAQALGWNRATVRTFENNEEDVGLCLHKMWPYWMNRLEAVPNDVDMRGIWFLTSPNMAGKSTLMRSTAAAALLSVCGFCAPVGEGSYVDRFDNLFVRGASSDVPSERKSAFGAEMGDVAFMLDACSGRSLAFVDELGRGTSPRDGTRIAAAVLEDMAMQGMTGVFATHLHDILDLPICPIAKRRISEKQMRVSEGCCWTYHCEDGICRDSLALVTAKQFGVPNRVLQRADQFLEFLPASNSQHVEEIEANQAHLDQVFDNPQTPAPLEERALTLTEQLTNKKPLSIPCDHIPPAHLAGKACLYILDVPLPNGSRSFYVGETQDMDRRLKEHRADKGPYLLASVVVASHRTEAQTWETLLIRKLSREGIPLLSDIDGRHWIRSS